MDETPGAVARNAPMTVRHTVKKPKNFALTGTVSFIVVEMAGVLLAREGGEGGNVDRPTWYIGWSVAERTPCD